MIIIVIVTTDGYGSGIHNDVIVPFSFYRVLYLYGAQCTHRYWRLVAPSVAGGRQSALGFLACTRHGSNSALNAGRSSYWSTALRRRRRAAAVAARERSRSSSAAAPGRLFTGGRSAPVHEPPPPPPPPLSANGHGWLGAQVATGNVRHGGRPMHLVRKHSCCIPSFRVHLQPTIICPPRSSNWSNPAVGRFLSHGAWTRGMSYTLSRWPAASVRASVS
jgi:hypothetical protein